jgi:ABC-type dipeptide/oligopeptide/nickel transport system permease component
MFKYVTKRLGLMLLTFLIIIVMSFILIKLLPIHVNVGSDADPYIAYKQLEGRGWICNIKQEENGTYSFDRVPILIQLVTYAKRIFTNGDFGIATTYGEYLNKPVWDVFVKSSLRPS